MHVRRCFGVLLLYYLGQSGHLVEAQQPPFEASLAGGCQRITVSMCEDVPYNYTRMPNHFGHMSQHQAEQYILEYKPLVQVSCSPYLKFFLCATHTPMCSESVETAIVACRSVCLSVQRSCSPLLKQFNLPWPESLNCSNFPEEGSLCMAPYDNQDEISRDSGFSMGFPNNPANHNPSEHSQIADSPGLHDVSEGHSSTSRNQLKNVDCYSRKLVQLEHLATRTTDATSICAANCNLNVHFSSSDKRFAEIWISVWATLCLLVSVFTVLTFLIDCSRFPYPERPIVLLSASYCVVSMGYILRLILKSSRVACSTERSSCPYFIQGGLESTECVVVFLMIYYFSNAATLWWVAMTYAWFLSTSLGWAKESIARQSSYFHLVSWALPVIQSFAVLITKKLDGEEVTGLCYVGASDPTALLWFVIVPNAVYLSVGTILFVTAWLSAYVNIRKTVDAPRRVGFDKLLTKNVIFSVLYIAAASVLLGCQIYEKMQLDKSTPFVRACLTQQLEKVPPRLEIYILRIFMSLVIGITSGIWVWSKKTWDTWKKVLFCGCFLGEKEQQKPQNVVTHSFDYRHHHSQSSAAGSHCREALLSKHNSALASSAGGCGPALNAAPQKRLHQGFIGYSTTSSMSAGTNL